MPARYQYLILSYYLCDSHFKFQHGPLEEGWLTLGPEPEPALRASYPNNLLELGQG